MASRRVPESPGLRARTARGGVVNAAFLSGAELLVLFQGLLATALLGPDAIGLYGIVTTTAMTIVALRRVGIDEAFVQTSADDEEAEFQRALTVELGLGVLGALGGRGAGAGARRRLRRGSAAGAHAGRDVPAGGVRAAGAAVGVLQAHGVRAAAAAAGDRAARDGRGDGAAAARGRGCVVARDRPVRRQPRRDPRRLAQLALQAAAPARSCGGAPLPALLVAGVRHGGRGAGGRAGADRGLRARGRARRGRLHHAGGDVDPLRRPCRPDRRDHDLPRDRARPGPRGRARGAVREGEPADA